MPLLARRQAEPIEWTKPGRLASSQVHLTAAGFSRAVPLNVDLLTRDFKPWRLVVADRDLMPRAIAFGGLFPARAISVHRFAYVLNRLALLVHPVA